MNTNPPTASLPGAAIKRIAWSLRRIPMSYGDHVPGRLAFRPPAQAIDVESGLEARVARKLLALPQLAGLYSQPFTLETLETGRWRPYTPDLLLVLAAVSPALVRFGFERWTVIEVKPEARYERSRDRVDGRLQHVRSALGLAAVCLTETFVQGDMA
jgi:hypothetical protein